MVWSCFTDGVPPIALSRRHHFVSRLAPGRRLYRVCFDLLFQHALRARQSEQSGASVRTVWNQRAFQPIGFSPADCNMLLAFGAVLRGSLLLVFPVPAPHLRWRAGPSPPMPQLFRRAPAKNFLSQARSRRVSRPNQRTSPVSADNQAAGGRSGQARLKAGVGS